MRGLVPGEGFGNLPGDPFGRRFAVPLAKPDVADRIQRGEITEGGGLSLDGQFGSASVHERSGHLAQIGCRNWAFDHC
jgi:hypothetical protein